MLKFGKQVFIWIFAIFIRFPILIFLQLIMLFGRLATKAWDYLSLKLPCPDCPEWYYEYEQKKYVRRYLKKLN